MIILNLVVLPWRHSWRKWPGSNRMLTKLLKHTKGKLPWKLRSNPRSLCWRREKQEVCIPQIPFIGHDLSHLVKCWVTAEWHNILTVLIVAPGMMSLLIHASSLQWWWKKPGEMCYTLKSHWRFFFLYSQENAPQHKLCMHRLHRLPSKPRIHRLTCWSASGSMYGCWLWIEGGN